MVGVAGVRFMDFVGEPPLFLPFFGRAGPDGISEGVSPDLSGYWIYCKLGDTLLKLIVPAGDFLKGAVEVAAQLIEQFVLLEVVVVGEFSLPGTRVREGRGWLGVWTRISFHLLSKID